MIVAGEILRPPQRFSVRLLGIAKLSRGGSTPGLNCTILT
ncbi:MAG: hypothetical protein QOD11_3070 [Bradyrhizobium sp.]|jgi:hypothetical protein|nr:hypothetical protein [Bradyrhizobium sp.]